MLQLFTFTRGFHIKYNVLIERTRLTGVKVSFFTDKVVKLLKRIQIGRGDGGDIGPGLLSY